MALRHSIDYGFNNCFFFFSYLGIDETVKLVQSAGGTCYGYVCNLCNREDVYKKAALLKEQVGKVFERSFKVL